MSVDYNRSENAQRPFTTSNHRSAMGRSTVDITCPFCGTVSRAYIWSISGGGKRCENKRKCGAKFTSFGVAYPVVGREDMQP